MVLPLISFAEPEDFAPLDRAIEGMEQFDWMILTSAQAVRAVARRAKQLHRTLVGAGSRLRVACVGPVTAEAGKKENLPVEHVAATHNAVALAEELGSQLAGARVFLPRSDRANPDLPAALKKHGAEVTEVIAYRTLRPAETETGKLRKIVEGQTNAILFFSPSAVHHFAELWGAGKLPALQEQLVITAVGPVTAKALREAGFLRLITASDTTSRAVVEALEKHFAGTAAASGVRRG